MKKVLLAVVAAAALAAPYATSVAEDNGDQKFVFNGMVRGRFDYFNNYFDLTDNDQSGDVNDDSLAFGPYRTMVGITGMFTDNVSAHVDLQYAGVFGDEFNPQKDIQLPIGQAVTPYLFNTQGVQLYQGYIELAKIFGSDVTLRLGRQEHTYSTELFLGDNDYYNGTSFDGLRGMWNHGHSDLEWFYYKVAEDSAFDAGAVDSDLYGVTYDWTFDKTWGKVGGYVIAAQDLDGFGPIGLPDSKLYTIGAHWTRPMTGGEGTLNMFDWNVEVAYQTGDALDPAAAAVAFDLEGDVEEGWFGWNFGNDKHHGRVHLGVYRSSGDDPNTTDKVETFTPLFGDFHANNRLGDMDFIESTLGAGNITNINAGFQYWLGRHSFMAAVHYNMLTDDTGFTDDKLGTEIDLGYGFQYSKNVSFNASIGEFMPDTGLEEFFGLTASDPVERATAEMTLRW